MATRNRQHWKLDNQGEYARQVGWKHSRNGKLIQHKFRLGADLKEAKRREQKLLELWGQVEEGFEPASLSFGRSFALDLGKQIAKGKFQIELPRKPHDSPEAYARYLHRLQRHYPMVSFVAEDEEAYVSGAAANRTMVQEQIGELQEQIAVKEAKHATGRKYRRDRPVPPGRHVARCDEGLHRMDQEGLLPTGTGTGYGRWTHEDAADRNPHDPPREPAPLDAG